MSNNNTLNNNTLNNNTSNNALAPNDAEVVDGALAELKKQYDDLAADIKQKYEEQQTIFKEMASTEYEGENYDQDRINHLIEADVANLKEQRDKIWKYLTTVYDQNTQQTYRNFRSLKNNEKQIVNNKKKKTELIGRVGDIKSENNTQKKLILHNNYKSKEVYNKSYVQLIIMVGLLTCIILLYLTTNGHISPMIGWGAVAFIGLITVLYYIYRIYIYRMNRDRFQWHKIYFRRIDPNQEAKNDENNDTSEMDYKKLDEDAKKLLSEYKQTCKSTNLNTLN
jgi:hypothetical protein